ncbi:MAG: hypothetical protein WKG06_22355 [Segetibacter sp.]
MDGRFWFLAKVQRGGTGVMGKAKGAGVIEGSENMDGRFLDWLFNVSFYLYLSQSTVNIKDNDFH